jgi:hypothetical protein
MSDQSPKGGAPPQCDRCHVLTHFVMTIPLVSEPGRVLLFGTRERSVGCWGAESYPDHAIQKLQR